MNLQLLFALTVYSVLLSINSERTEAQFRQELSVYASLNNLISFFKNETHSLAPQIVDTFDKKCQFPEYNTTDRGALLKPVIVIEGNHKSSRDVVVLGLAKMMNARYVAHPAPCIHHLHPLLPKGSLLRRAFYLLSNYAGSRYAKSQLNRPVVINGYWTEQLAFSLAHFYPPGGLPPITDDIFKFPQDLLKPDLIFYLNFPDRLIHSHVTTRSPLTWKPRMLEVFRHMQARHPIVIMEMKSFFKLTTEEIHRYILHHFYDKLFGIWRNSTERVTN